MTKPALLLTVLASLCCAAAPARPFAEGKWDQVGRGTIKAGDGILRSEGAAAVAGDPKWQNYELRFEARAPGEAPEAQLWCAVRCFDRDRKYVVGLRGGNNQQLFVSRYAPFGQDRFLGYRPLNFAVKPGEWYKVRVQIVRDRIAVYLRDDDRPFMVVRDVGTKEWPAPQFSSGRVAVGGGYLPAEYRNVEVRELDASTAFPEPVSLAEPEADKEKRRVAQRSAYRPTRVADAADQSLSLNGDWLFLPDYAFEGKANFAAPDLDDSRWHVMSVPNFWTPTLAWLYGEQANFSGPFMGDKGQSDNWWSGEEKRCDGYTFDWRRTKSAWYRQHVSLPADLGDKRYELCFDGIAKHSELWVNGTKVSDNLGMFRELRADATKYLHGGDNVIAVRCLSREAAGERRKNPDQVLGVAITVEVTARMLYDLPEGMYRGLPAGIWQPVSLNISDKTHVRDVFFKPRTEGASIEVEVENTSASSRSVEVSATFASKDDGAALATDVRPASVQLAPGEAKTVTLDTGACTPKLWTPDDPRLYRMAVMVSSGGRTVNAKELDVGFRTFVVSGKQFLLNGKPYWLRGGNLTPQPLRPNDAALAEKFLGLMHDHNVRVTRSHVSPFNTTWLDAADRIGVGVSYEGIWPWLMLRGNLPEKSVLQDWSEEWLGLVRKYRNHPSILMWTVNNEMHLDQTKDLDLRTKKWAVLSGDVRDIRSLDPTRPVVADSGYHRGETRESYEAVVAPNHFDDGDVDDFHHYPGWYNPTFYHEYSFAPAPRFVAEDAGRPVISQELATGYPRIDDGLPTRFYAMDHLTPQANVGDFAYETSDPKIFLDRVALHTKMIAEALRRGYQEGNRMAGALHFSLVTWFRNAYDAKTVQPTVPAAALRQGLAPVLVSAEITGWHYYAGASVPLEVSVLNGSEPAADLPATRLEWSVRSGDSVLSHGSAEVPAVAYYAQARAPITVSIPATLPAPSARAELRLEVFREGRVVASNSYPIFLATKEWAAGRGDVSATRYDPRGSLSPLLDGLGLKVPAVPTVAQALADPGKAVVIADFDWTANAADLAAFHKYLAAGGKPLLCQPGEALARIAPQAISAFRARDGEIVTMHVPESAVLGGIEPNDLAWFTGPARQVPIATHGDFLLADPLLSPDMIVQHVPIHGYLNSLADRATQTGAVVFSVRQEGGRIWVTQMAHEFGATDPVAARVFRNLLDQLK